MRREIYWALNGLDPRYGLTFDYEFWIRLARRHEMRRIPAVLAQSRMHPGNKSLSRREEVFRETFEVMLRHYGYVPFRWVYAYLCFLADHRDQFFEPLEPSITAYLKSLPAGAWMNRGQIARYLSDWASVLTWDSLRRRVFGMSGSAAVTRERVP
jgi:hypothetical protein